MKSFGRRAIALAAMTCAASALFPTFAAEITVRCDLGQDLVLTATKAASRLAIAGTDHELIVNIQGTCTLRHSLFFQDSSTAATYITFRGVGSNPTIRASANFDDFGLIRFVGVFMVSLENLTIDGSFATYGSASNPAVVEFERVHRADINNTTIVGGVNSTPLVCTDTAHLGVWLSTITGGSLGVHSLGCGLDFLYTQILGAQNGAMFLNSGSDAILEQCHIGAGSEWGVGVWNSELELGPGTIVDGVLYANVFARRSWVRLRDAKLLLVNNDDYAVEASSSSHIESYAGNGQGQITGDLYLSEDSSYDGTGIAIEGWVDVTRFSRAYLGHVTQGVYCSGGGDAVVQAGADGGVFGCASAPLSPVATPAPDSRRVHRAAAEQRVVAMAQYRTERMRRLEMSGLGGSEPVRSKPRPHNVRKGR